MTNYHAELLVATTFLQSLPVLVFDHPHSMNYIRVVDVNGVRWQVDIVRCLIGNVSDTHPAKAKPEE
jgi:hypothetical protein